ncbi:MAG: DUF2851 family protein, partial [Chitinophagaceae bacterium]|nr:DUF2851 family protein [Chitinophagaceae bacterium]
MTERLLQYIWQLRHYNCRQLRTEQGERLEVLYPGAYNSNQGPDFLEAKILINGTLWVGNIELHLRTSDWKKHTHHTDDKYKNVIMHVVWQHDLPGGAYFNMPTLELQPYVSALLLNRYGDMMRRSSFIPCENSVKDVPALVWDTWKERLMLERLQSKALHVKKLLEENNYNWEEALWWMIARNFGMKVNSEAFEAIARSVPFITLGRHRNQIHQTEALLFGQAGLLDKQFKGQYPLMLQKEYRFLKRKYQLEPVNIPLLFLRMRPPNFPSVRLAQLAMFIKTYSHFFSTISECIHLKDVASLLQVTANDYWNYHYRFDECSNFQPKTLGESTINNIIINAVVPVLY